MAIYDGKLTLDHNWGDINGDGTGSVVASGEQVQEFVRTELKTRVGYFWSFSKNNIQNILIGFVNKEIYDAWLNDYKDPETGSLNPNDTDKLTQALADERVVSYTEVAKGIPDPFYSAKLENKYSSNRYISVDGQISIPVRFTSTYNEYDAVTGELQISDLGEQGTLEIQARQDSTISWDSPNGISKTTQSILPTAYNKLDSDVDSIQYVNLTNFLSNGSWELRMRVKNNTADQTTSSWVNYSVIKTSINVTLSTPWATALETPNGVMSLSFSYSGAYVDKYLNIEITGAGATTTGGLDKKTVVVHLGTAANDNVDVNISSLNSDTYRVSEHGIHQIKYWVNIEQNSDYETAPKYTQLMVASDKNNLNPYIILNNIKGDKDTNPLTNWANEDILSYAVYAPTAQGELQTNFPVKLSFRDAIGNEYFNDIYVINSKLGEIKTVNKDLAIEADGEIIAPRLYAESNFDNLDTQYNLLVTKAFMQFYVNNLGDYAPSPGADFIFNPRVRSNSESDIERKRIFNAATGEAIGEGEDSSLDENAVVKWSGVNFNDTDGWVQDDQGRKCLRLLDGQQLIIPYQPFSRNVNGFDSPSVNCFTFELTVATRNIIDNSIPLIQICDEYEIEGQTDPMINGFELRGNDAYFITNKTRSRGVLDVHDVMFQEGQKTHIVVNICHNTKKVGDENLGIAKGEIKTNPTDAAPEVVTLNQDYHFIRIYVNGVLNRVINYTGNPLSDELQTPGSGTGKLKRYIVLGNTGVFDEQGNKIPAADLDVYEIRVYKRTSFKSDKDVLKDYISSLSSIDEKKVMVEANDILDENTGKISYNKAVLKYNTLLLKPSPNSLDNFVRPCGREFGDTKKTSNTYNVGNLEVRLFKTNAQGKRELDEAKSGVINDVFAEGQGTSAMTYYKWNQRHKLGETDETTYFTPFNTDYDKIKKMYPLNDNDPMCARLDGKLNWASSMQSHKMGTTALYNDCQKAVVGGNMMCWINSVEAFSKIDLKKTGAKIVIGQDEQGEDIKETPTEQQAFENACKFTGRSNAYGNCRTCVRQEPFLFFVQSEYKKDSDGNPTADLVDPVYYGPLTWGASKGDKPTFGYNKEFNKYFVMIEGTDNDRELIMCRVPWDDVHVTQAFEAENEGDPEADHVVDGGNYYGGAEQFEISMGKDSKEYIGAGWGSDADKEAGFGKNPCLKMFKDMINFAYLHNHRIEPYKGTYEQLKLIVTEQDFTNAGLDKTKFYWVTQASNGAPSMSPAGSKSEIYDLYRFNVNDVDGDPSWVPAGFYDTETRTYAALNLQTQLQLKSTELIGTDEENNNTFINARVARFRNGYKDTPNHPYGYTEEYANGIGEYVNLKDLQFTLQFLKLVAGTDNWGKNTYFYNTGVYYKQNPDGSYMGGSAKYGGLEKFAFFQDDMDTIFEIDNSGQKTKPYYVEEHDIAENDGTTIRYYWNSQTNALFNLAERAYESEMKSTMSSIFDEMARLGGSPEACFEKYYQAKTKEDYPAVVHNQNAEIMYLDGYYRGSEKAKDTHHLFLSQCLGDQGEAEREWQKNRVHYMSSYASWGNFAPGTGGGGGIAMRSKGYAFTFNLTPHTWLYPVITHGSTDIYYTKGDANPFGTIGRVAAGNTITLQTKADSETQVRLKSIDSYRDIGNFARHTADSQFTLSGSRISDFIVRGTKENPILFNPSASFNIDANANIDNLRNFEVSGNVANNAQIMNYALNLQRLWRLESLDLTATSTTGVTLPDNSNIKIIKLPNTVRDLKLIGQKKLSTFELGSYNNLRTIEINDTPFINTLQFVNKCIEVGAKITSLTLLNITWEEVELNTLKYILNIPNTNITGVIRLKNTEILDFTTKSLLLNKFGNIDNESNSLHIQYTIDGFSPQTAKILGDTYISKNGYYQFTLSAKGNDYVEIDWMVSTNEHATMDNTGLMTFIDKGDGTREVTVTCSILRKSGVTNKITKIVYFKEKDAEIGDYVYFDGSLSSPADYNPDKTVVGVCYYINGDDRRMMAVNLASNESVMWGMSSTQFPGVAATAFPISPATIGLGSLGSLSSYTEYSSASITTKSITQNLTTAAFSSAGVKVGMKQFPEGSVLPCGQYNTIYIIEHRNENVINKGIGSSVIPGQDDALEYTKNEKQHLEELITNSQLLSKLDIEASLYPAASHCYSYVPVVKEGETLNENFTKHNWYLPSMSELLYMWKCSCPDMIGTTKNEVGLGHCEPLKTAGVWVEPSSWGNNSGPVYWSSNQEDNSKARAGQFRTNNFRTPTYDSTTGGGSDGKINRYYIRACARF